MWEIGKSISQIPSLADSVEFRDYVERCFSKISTQNIEAIGEFYELFPQFRENELVQNGILDVSKNLEYEWAFDQLFFQRYHQIIPEDFLYKILKTRRHHFIKSLKSSVTSDNPIPNIIIMREEAKMIVETLSMGIFFG